MIIHLLVLEIHRPITISTFYTMKVDETLQEEQNQEVLLRLTVQQVPSPVFKNIISSSVVIKKRQILKFL